MTGAEFGFVILRIVGFLIALYALVSVGFAIPQVFVDPVPGDFGLMLRVNLVLWVVLLGVGLQLFIGARRFASFLFSSAEGSVDAVGQNDLQTIAFSVVGLWLAAFALPAVVQLGAELFWTLRAGAQAEREAFWAENGFYLVRTCAELAVGGWLFARSRAVSRYWNSMKNRA